MDQKQLQQDLVNHFDESGLQALCFHIPGVDYADLPGTTWEAKARELVLMMARGGRLLELTSCLIAERPLLQDRYQPEDNLSWIDRLARGGGPPIEELPTATWPHDDDTTG